METLIVKYDSSNKAVAQVLSGLMKLGAITIVKSPYDDEFVAKIAKGDKDIEEGKGVSIADENIIRVYSLKGHYTKK